MSAVATYQYSHIVSGVPARTAAVRSRRGIFRRISEAIMRSNQRRAERDIARVLGVSGGLTDEMERRITEHLVGNRSFRM